MSKRSHFIVQRGLVALLTLCVLLGGHALAQTYTEGSIAGTVFDPSGAVVANAAIVIHNIGTNAEIQLTSDASGFFKAPQLAAAIYTVTVKAEGFAPFKEVNVIVQVGQTTEVLPHLLAAGATSSVEVTGEAPILNFESPDISSVLTSITIESLPLNGGRWSDMALLTPGAVGDSNGFGLISFRGISPMLNNVEIDGADDNQAYYSEERGRTREGYSTSKYLIEEFQVNTGVYSAEYGRAAGGVINAISKSGTNTLHGIAYFSDRDNDWGAMNPYTTNTVNTSATSTPTFETIPYKPVDWRKEWGFDAGGPLMKDKLFWFYGFAQYRRNFPGDRQGEHAWFVLHSPRHGSCHWLQLQHDRSQRGLHHPSGWRHSCQFGGPTGLRTRSAHPDSRWQLRSGCNGVFHSTDEPALRYRNRYPHRR